ncbi:MAG: dethiobiotin synthase [Clostridia bacterium]|jgi:dethiobiotin synthetase|nr:dethiobiotin synthase [Clostridia bacterium]
MAKGVFVVGTGTDVGKTYVAALLAKAVRKHGAAAYYKAAVSGNARDEHGALLPADAIFVRQTAGLCQPLATMCPYVYENAWSPHLAALHEGDPVDLGVVLAGLNALRQRYDYITMEGSGGIVCPLRYDGQSVFLTDVVAASRLPCVLVADARLGAINAVVLTAEYMRARGIRCNGLIFNRFEKGDPVCEDNARVCEQLTGYPVVARLSAGAVEFPVDPLFLYE